MQFVMAHELLHVGLRHEARRQGRDAWLWNVACDYVINGWLIEMGVGEMPTDDLLLDPEPGRSSPTADAIRLSIRREHAYLMPDGAVTVLPDQRASLRL